MNGIKVEAEFKKLEFPANRRALRDIVRPRTSEIGTEKSCDITTDDEVIVPANALERIKNIGENDLLFTAICSPRFQKKTSWALNLFLYLGSLARDFLTEKLLTDKSLSVHSAGWKQAIIYSPHFDVFLVAPRHKVYKYAEFLARFLLVRTILFKF